MGIIGTTAKIIVAVVLLVVVAVVFFAFNPDPRLQFYILIIVVASMCLIAVVYLVKFKSLTKTFQHKPHKEYIYKQILAGEIPGKASKDGTIFWVAPYDISAVIGDHHYMRIDDNGTKRNFFYDILNDVPRGEINFTALNSSPERALNMAIKIVEDLKSGRRPTAVTLPDVERVVEKNVVKQKEEEEKN